MEHARRAAVLLSGEQGNEFVNTLTRAADPPIDLSKNISIEEWLFHRKVVESLRRREIRFTVGGGFAFSAYSGRWRNTKDLDLFILPSDRESAILTVTDAGFSDYFEQLPYDPAWIYRGYREGHIVDLIWAMANHSTFVDENWLGSSRSIMVHGLELPLVPVEELIYSKLYVLQRERCDWPDLFNIIYRQSERLDWERLINCVGNDAPLLGAVMRVFAWLCPEPAAALPRWIWERLCVLPPDAAPGRGVDRGRIAMIDTRDWFGPAGIEGLS
jgi:hypothetical protein